jgi:CheY-like chemotaxis protein
MLMNTQMPIVDGLTSTKMIRSFEKTHKDIYSPRAALNGRVPIIAVSASLIEKNRQRYMNAGFDAWILKPISFLRLNELMAAIVDRKIRESCLYQPGDWERGGWFHVDQSSAEEVSTIPSGELPIENPSKAMEEAAKNSEDPTAGDEPGRIPDEQDRLLREQEKEQKSVDLENEATPESKEDV